MNAAAGNANAAVERYEALIRDAHAGLPATDQAWLESKREQARTAFAESAFPTKKSELWRYTGLDSLLQTDFSVSTEPFTALMESDLDEVSIPGLDAHRLVFANGRLVESLSQLEGVPEGVQIQSLRTLLENDPERAAQWLHSAASEDSHVFNDLNTALINDGLVVIVAPGVHLDKPIDALYLSEGLEDAIVSQPRNLIVLEEGARATLIERHASFGQSMYFNNSVSELLLAANAELTHYRLQEESPSAFHLSSLFLRQQRDSVYRSTSIALGGAWARTDFNVDFQGEGANCELDGLYLAGDRQLVDFHLNVLHKVPGCSSRENFRGILHGKGRAVFDGRILVAQDAQKTDAQLSNNNLLLTRSAEVDTKPQLEIYADDVKCSHGTTVGQLDPQHMFYLRSRGIDTGEARKMLCLGFAREVLDSCAVEGVRERAELRLRDALEHVATDEI